MTLSVNLKQAYWRNGYTNTDSYFLNILQRLNLFFFIGSQCVTVLEYALHISQIRPTNVWAHRSGIYVCMPVFRVWHIPLWKPYLRYPVYNYVCWLSSEITRTWCRRHFADEPIWHIFHIYVVLIHTFWIVYTRSTPGIANRMTMSTLIRWER